VSQEIDPSEFRRVLGHLPTGVTVISAFAPEETGMAVNSFISVSLSPPLVLFCPAKSSTTWPRIRDAGGFCVSILAEHHEEVSRAFALRDADRFAGLPWHRRATGPALDEAVGWIDCSVREEHPAGDHTIVVAAVEEMAVADGVAPLVFVRGRYGAVHHPGDGRP
jgi:3-hydroxy-9,10-secoandrosta-1,3,5(10)-triene-9,17-dione monooxygenase reductase component